MPEFINKKYCVYVEHNPSEFEIDMEYTFDCADSASRHYQTVRKKYSSRRIKITEITEKILERSISAKRLKELSSAVSQSP